MDAPKKDCDLVMKGGVTSGIVYPPAILALKDKYRFRCIGGASAGAIAAAVAAAAEFGRESERAGSGFAGLANLEKKISTQGFMRDLFRPTGSAPPLFHTLLDGGFVSRTPSKKRSGFGRVTYVLGGTARNVGIALAVVKNNPLSALIGAIAAFALAVLFGTMAIWQAAWWRVGAAALLVLAGAVVGGAVHLAWILFFELPRQRFGMCSGIDAKGRTVLTSWLADEIDTLAGRAPDARPLTFADLKGKTARDPSGATRDAGITLQMVTSNLSHQMPLLLPFETHELLFQRDEMAELFPERVVRYLVDHAGERHPDATEHGPRPAPPAGYHYLPREDELPVIVATRMSLSFPILLQAVPLYVVRVSAHAARAEGATTPFAAGDLMRLWFSDGGISSNFPIHLFDAWLPGRPTFGINLGDVPAEHVVETAGQPAAAAPSAAAATGPQYFDRAQFGSVGVDAAAPQDREPDEELAEKAGIPDVYLPKPNRVLPPRWVDIRGLFGFLGQVFATAQNYHDTTQMMLPGCRERVAQVLLAKDEGGLNLDMPEATLKGIVDKGRRAGLLLHDFEFDPHAWVRFRVLMDKLEQRLMEWRSRVGAQEPGYVGLIEHNATRAHCYPMDGAQERRAERRMRSLALLVQVWKAHDDERESEVLAKLEALLAPNGAPLPTYAPEDADRVFTNGAPRPKSVLRVTPLL